MIAAKEKLVELGARLVPVTFLPVVDALRAWGRVCSVETAVAHEATYPSRAPEYEAGLGGFLASASRISATELGKAGIERRRFAGKVAEVVQDIDVLIAPC